MEILKLAQEAKKVALENGEVVIGLSLASLAFGIPQDELSRIMFREGKCLVIEGMSTGDRVRISLSDSPPERQRDLWQEMIASLERGRSDVYLTKRAYTDLARELQRGAVYNWDEDSDLLQIALIGLWENLTPGLQRALESCSPEKIRSNLGIAGSGE